ncbi:WD40 repeat-like protein [Pseudovirgaria hyperparasitica]|uniref:Pre-rRNA-processing protein IPI3 n=1 Tax=Pseudovirgaria hyperparasitica TaxID=470096 RepID=A0A6A6W8J5_9PEZI|nr:WD40 repeat-like protein [Pseudovirgaria hyperparasitica]KAF2757401.1 WD40 repeat-like protein [Pseudovirgaria hyperparasitica]
MLSELLVASIAAPIKAPNTSVPKDAGIFIHEFLPLPAQRHILKKSATPPNCLAISATHIFAAQAEKAVVHVYNREKGSQEAIIPFQERIHAIALAVDDTVLALGTQTGRLLLWEICTGRLVVAPVSHLQEITAVVVDRSSNFLLTGSADSSVNVWSLPHLLSFSSGTECKSPLRSLSSHRGAITSLAIGHSSTSANIAVSTSADNTAIIWDYQTGTLLRTYLLGDTPLATVLDPADRAFYTSYADGSVQLIDFFDPPSPTDALRSTTPNTPSSVLEPPKSSRWHLTAETLSLGSAQCLTLSWDGTTLLSGHASGKIATWDVARGRWASTLATLPGAVTNISMLAPTGFPAGSSQAEGPKTRISNVVKPRLDIALDTPGPVPASYTLTISFPTTLLTPKISLSIPATDPPKNAFEEALSHTTFPDSLLASSLAEIHAWSTSAPSHLNNNVSSSSDFLGLDNDDTAPAVPVLSEAERVVDLEARLAALQRVQKVTFAQLAELRRERDTWGPGKDRADARTAGQKGQGKKGDEMDVDMDVDGPVAVETEGTEEMNGRRKGGARQAKNGRLSR